ncbi:putative methyltransferase TARBP1 [Pseudolycoriella hygida]|uniref:Methyltransferase TARBP1 n=1 Tax=Pseudolycoriella hygida TaxID=35572 RepID=A0A9Q0NHK4_9DIPT|nr:putative methyltransferase TARBP1 [Pseudolycoriella hygida]
MQEIYSKLFQAVNNKHLLLYKLASKFLTEDKCFLESESNLGHIQRMLLYGNPATGDQRVENDLCQLLYNDFDWAAPSHIRFEFIDKFLRNVDGNAATQLRNTLYEMSVNLNLSKSRYYPDSEQHRLKLRLVQALAILKDHRLNEAILTEQNQVNVTYIMELIVAATSDIKDAVALLEQAKTNSARQSIFVIMYYVCSRLRDAKGSDICIEKIIPFTMGQHFNTRLLAQVTIVKLIEKFYSLDDKFHRHHAVYEQIKISFSHGNAKQISEKFLQDFRFTCIDCDNLLHQIYILYEIPRITKMAEDELFPLRLLKTDLEDETFLFKEPFYVHTNFSNVYENECLRLGVDVESNGYTLQKKLIPIKSMRPDPDLLVTLPCDTYRRYGEGLIVVANLVSRLPNLGGLTRTCEIFGVEQLILDSLKRVENPEFQSVSMTSEKWMNIGELKTWQLFDYLMSMKSNGYYIVGAEQTSNGKMLTDLNFPKKTVLLLGSEKDGIPANLLSVLDVAVEIPQFGVVRSLNVHVSPLLRKGEEREIFPFSAHRNRLGTPRTVDRKKERF